MTSPITVTLEQVTALRNGLDPILATIEEALQAKAFAAQLPLVGDQLAAAFAAGQSALTQFQAFETDLTNVLNALNDAQGYTLDDLQAAIDNAVAQSGFAGMPQLSLDDQGTLTVSLAETDTQTFSQSLADNFGLPNIGLQTTGTAQASIDYGVNLTASIDSSGNFSVAQSDTPALQVGLDVTAPSFSADAQLGALRFAATDQGSNLNGSFAIDDQGNATFTGGATLAVGLTSDLGDAALPSVSATLAGDWNFASSSVDPTDIASFGSAPDIEFDGVSFDFGAFFDKFVKPILDQIVPYLKPVQQALAVLNTDITFIKDLLPNNAWQALDKAGAVDANGNDAADGKITLLDLLKLADPTQDFAPVVQTLQTIQQVISLAAFLDNTSLGPDSYDLGNIKILDDIRAASFNVAKAATQLVQQGQNLANFLQDSGGAYANAVQGTGSSFGDLLAALIPNDDSSSGGSTGTTANNIGLSLPILTDPAGLAQFLLGGTSDLMGLNLPTLSFGLGNVSPSGAATQVEPIATVPSPVPGVEVGISGALSVALGLDFGYDTSGLLAYAQGGYTDPSLLADGAWVSNPSSGDLLSVGGAIQVNLEAGVPGAFTIGGGGDLSGVLNLSLSNTGKNYLDQLASQVASDPLSILSASGALTAGADLDVSAAGVDLYRYLSPLITLASFSTSGSAAPNGGTTGASATEAMPTVQSVYLTAIDGDPDLQSGDYGVGHVMQITVTFSQAVTVTGTPEITLNSNGVGIYDAGATAALNDPTTLVFDYTVGAGDASIPGLAYTGINLPPGTAITNASGLPADVTDQPTIYFNNVSLETSSPKAYAATLFSVNGQVNVFGHSSALVTNLNVGHPAQLALTFTHEVSVVGTPELTLNTGGVAIYDAAATAALNDPTKLIFDYTVTAKDSAVPDLAVTGVMLPSGAAIMDQAGNAADLSSVADTFTGLQALEPSPFNTPGYVVSPQFWDNNIAVSQDGPGNVFMVGDYYGPQAIVQSVDNSGTVMTPVALDPSTDGFEFSFPTVSTLANGNAVATWVRMGASQSIQAAILDPQGNILTTAFQVNAATADTVDQPSVAGLANGGFAVAWMDHVGNGYETVRTQVFDNAGNAVGSETVVATDANGFTTTPSVTALSDGDYLVTWWTHNTLAPAAAQLFSGSGAAISDPFVLGGFNLVTTALAGGGFAAAWDGNGTILVQTFDASGNAIGTAQPVDGNDDDIGFPRIAGLANGGFVVGWDTSFISGVGQVQQGQYFDAAANRIGSPFLIGSINQGTGANEALTGLPNGNFVASWDAFGPAPQVEEFTPGTTLAPDVTLPAPLFTNEGSVPAGGVNLGVVLNDTNAIEQDAITLTVGDGTLDFGLLDNGYAWATALVTGGSNQSNSIAFTGRVDQIDELLSEGASYTPDADLTGADTLTVTATVGGWQQSYSVPIIVNALPTGTVDITGDATPGSTLTADISTLADANGLGTLHYQWQTSFDAATWTDVGTDQSSYVVQNADAYDFVRVVVSYTDGLGTQETVNSDNAPSISPAGPSIDYLNSTVNGSVTEDTPIDPSALHTVSGVIDFTDTNLTSTHTASISTYPFGSLSAVVTEDSTGTGYGQVTWTYQATDPEIATLLGSLSSSDIYFDVTVSDQYGNAATDYDGDIMLQGPPPAGGPAIDAADSTIMGTITEGSPPDSSAERSISGIIAFTDSDLSSTHSASFTAFGGLGTFDTALTEDSTGTGSGQVTWTYDATDADLATMIAAGQTDLFFEVTVADQNGTAVHDLVDVTLADEVACFLPGTLIRTAQGEVPVERLREGDSVITLGGQRRRLIWIGHGKALVTRGRRTAATPIIVRKGALADNVPHRDLHITKGHSLYFDGVLVPAEFLINHRSILWDDRAQEVTVYHLELDSHDILLANGAPAESYRDDGNRWLFRNANSRWGLPPQKPCAPVLTGGAIVDAIWRRLLDRAGPRPSLPLTHDPDLHLVMDGRRIEPAHRAHDTFVFQLPGGQRTTRIVSRSVVPQELGLARDQRELGVALRQLVIRQGTRFRVVTADDARLEAGFHAFEPADRLRWTNGNALLPKSVLDGFADPVEVVLTLAATTRYLDTGEAVAAA